MKSAITSCKILKGKKISEKALDKQCDQRANQRRWATMPLSLGLLIKKLITSENIVALVANEYTIFDYFSVVVLKRSLSSWFWLSCSFVLWMRSL